MKDNLHQAVDPELKQEIDNLYRDGAREQPSTRLDDEILSLAARHLETQPQPAIKRQGVRRFPYVVSTAASLLLLVSLVLVNPDLVHFGDKIAVPAETELLPASAPQKMSEQAPESLQAPEAPAMMKMVPRNQAAPSAQSMPVTAQDVLANEALRQATNIDERLNELARALADGNSDRANALIAELEANPELLSEAQRERLADLVRTLNP